MKYAQMILKGDKGRRSYIKLLKADLRANRIPGSFIQYDEKFRCFWAVDKTLAGDEKLQERDPKMYQYLRLLRSLIQEQSMMFNVSSCQMANFRTPHMPPIPLPVQRAPGFSP